MSTLLTVIHVITCIFLMLTVLLQDGKSGMGGAFGGGNATTMFGGSGASTFLRKLTAGAATVFMMTSIVLAFLASHNTADSLEKFGENQAKLAADKEAAKAKALEGAGKGSGSAGSGSAAPVQIQIGPDGKPMLAPGVTVTPGPVTPAANGSAAPAANGSAAPANGSAAPAANVEQPLPPPAPSMGEPKPAGTGSASPAGTKAATDKSSQPAAGSAAATPAVIEKKPLTGTASPVNPQPAPAASPQTSDKPLAPSKP